MTHEQLLTAEAHRLTEVANRQKNWQRWGPYLAERQWGTVREDYSANEDVWNYFTHEQSRSRAYRWGEDGLLGICDRQCRLCFSLALWNGRDTILKERLYGLTGPEGNHGEDVKECYYYLDSTPTHSYMKALYKYPQCEFPYKRLIEENGRRSKADPEFELVDTGAFDENRYFDVFAEYAKASPDDVLIRITVANRGPEPATIHVLPTLWYRNAWTWGCTHEGCEVKPRMEAAGPAAVVARHVSLGEFRLDIDRAADGSTAELVFTDNETNSLRVFGDDDGNRHVKDAFHDYVIHGNSEAVNARQFGTKAAAIYRLTVPAGAQTVVRLRLTKMDETTGTPFADFDAIFAKRIAEADAFYADRIPADSISIDSDEAARNVARQAYAGLLWSKQFYQYIVKDWLAGDANEPPPPAARRFGRNHDWPHLYNRDVISMPDKWEYPWYAAWDLAFHMIPMATVDPEFAKGQLELFLREWYLHPNGQMPAYEWELSDVNPPVHAWACWRVYKMTDPRGERDVAFLKRVFTKLLLNFTWWVNRKDVSGRHLFAGGFLGLDNIGVFDRSKPLPGGGHLEQADGTAWMAFYASTMLAMALELAQYDDTYEDIASKFFEHFVHIADAMNTLGGMGLWHEESGFYYDQLKVDETVVPLGIRSIVGIIPLFAGEVLEQDDINRLPGFRKRMEWFLKHRPDLGRHIAYCDRSHQNANGARTAGRRLLAIPSRERLECVLRYLLDESEFLSPHGIRALSRYHHDHPFVLQADGQEYRVDYTPGESITGLFGGNSNWRGPIWFPINYLVIEALERYHHFYGDEIRVECPTGSGTWMNLFEASQELRRRLATLFLPDALGRRACHGDDPRYATDPHWRDLPLFHEYFHGDTGRGLGASHQTGWTALVATILRDLHGSPRSADKFTSATSRPNTAPRVPSAGS